MKSLRCLFLIPLSIFCFQSTAQVEDLMRDKNITWMVESYNDFMTDYVAEEQLGKSLGEVMKERPVKELRIVQNWYWDNKKKQLEIKLTAVGPLMDIKSDAGEFLYKIPLFYRRTDDCPPSV